MSAERRRLKIESAFVRVLLIYRPDQTPLGSRWFVADFRTRPSDKPESKVSQFPLLGDVGVRDK